MRCISVTVEGQPQPQGSTSSFIINGRVRTVSANPKNKSWRSSVALALQKEWDSDPQEGPFMVEIKFFLARPKSRPKRKSHLTKPDLDKLCRSVLDAGTEGGVWIDDSHVSSIVATKDYEDGRGVRAEITIAQA